MGDAPKLLKNPKSECPDIWIRLPRHKWPKYLTTQLLCEVFCSQEKQKWAIEKPNLDNARRLRGIYFIDPEDKEFKKTIRHATKKLETPMAPAMPCKTCKKSKKAEIRSNTNDFKSKFACILKASESTRMRVEESLQIIMRTILQGRRTIHCKMTIWCTYLFLYFKQLKYRQQRQRWTKNGKKLQTIPAWQLTKVRNKSEVSDGARTEGKTVHFASLMDICYLKIAESEPKYQKYKGRGVFRGDIVKDDPGSYEVFTEQGSSASQMTAAKVMDVISRLPGCAGQAADAVSA